MKVTQFFLGVLAAQLANSASIPQHEARQQDCVVNAQHAETWTDGGPLDQLFTRNRLLFSSENTPVEQFCDYWEDPTVNDFYTFNVACYYRPEANSWVVDSSWMRGAGGDNAYAEAIPVSLEWWKRQTGCRSG